MEVIDAQKFNKLLEKIAADILSEVNLEEYVIIGIRTRGYFLAERLKRIFEEKTKLSLDLGAIDITFYRDDLSMKFSHPSVESTDIPFSIEDKKILLVDDVLHTGRTVRAAIDVLFDFGRPKKIDLVVLIDRTENREIPFFAKFYGKKLSLYNNEKVNVYCKEYDGMDKVEIQ